MSVPVSGPEKKRLHREVAYESDRRQRQTAAFEDCGGNGHPANHRPYKETLFNMIQNDLYGRSFLDLFAGSGAIGIEALSRGASEAVFIDNGIRQVSCIRDNLKTTKLESGAKVLNCGVLEGLSRLGRDHGAFDFIFMDPPYGCDLERQVLEALQDSPLADGDTVLIAEASLDTDFSWQSPWAMRSAVPRNIRQTNMYF